jgi:hypothetical protein
MRFEVLRAVALFMGCLAPKKEAQRSNETPETLTSTPKGNNLEDGNTFLYKFYVLPYKIYFSN